jgi:predicted nucleic acid-binding protein
MLIYLDNCCFNRPFDDQTQTRVRLEAEAKLFIQEQIIAGNVGLAWSYMLDYENSFNPFEDRRRAIERWRTRSQVDIVETPELLDRARQLHALGLRSKDALHIACAIAARCDFFLSTDDLLLRKLAGQSVITALNPLALAAIIGEEP